MTQALCAVPATSTKTKKGRPKGWPFLVFGRSWNEAAKPVQPNHEVMRQHGSAATAAPKG